MSYARHAQEMGLMKTAEQVEITRLRQRVEELEEELATTSTWCLSYILGLQKDAERWREVMLEWGYGVHNGMGEFWNEVGDRMTKDEKKAAMHTGLTRFLKGGVNDSTS